LVASGEDAWKQGRDSMLVATGRGLLDLCPDDHGHGHGHGHGYVCSRTRHPEQANGCAILQ
jgi:hypothetical protein